MKLLLFVGLATTLAVYAFATPGKISSTFNFESLNKNLLKLHKIHTTVTVVLVSESPSPIYDMKWGHFDRVNFTFKMLRSSWNFDTVFKKFRSFDAENLGSVG